MLTRGGQARFIGIYFSTQRIDPVAASRSLQEEQKINETAACRAVEISVEDHPKLVSASSLSWAQA